MIDIKDYQEWVKTDERARKAKEGEELSTLDEQANRTLYQQYIKQAELLNQKKEAEAQVQAQKEQSLRDNYIAQAQAQKKAEDAMKMQGIATGVSESGLIDLYAQGAAARANILNSSNSATNDIISEYRKAVAESNIETNAAIAEIDAQREASDESGVTAYDNFTALLEGYQAGQLDFETLENKYKEILEKDKTAFDSEEYELLKTQYEQHLKDYEDTTVNVYNDSIDEFGKFFGMGRENSNQHDYLENIVADAKAGKIKEGQYIIPNYGKHLDKRSYVYQYLGNGRFKKIERDVISVGKGRQAHESLDVYTPEGYDYKDGGWRKFWGTTKVKKSMEKRTEELSKEHPKLYNFLKKIADNIVDIDAIVNK